VKRLWRAPGGKAALCLTAALALVTAFADFIASDRPIAARLQGKLFLFPNVVRPTGFPEDMDALRARMREGDWYLPPLVPYGPTQSRIAGEVRALRPPSSDHWLGTDRAGCDVLARLVHGARASLGVGLFAALFTALLGTALGIAAGAGGRLADGAFTRLSEAATSFPPLVLLCALQALALRPGVLSTALVLAAAGWPHVFRLVRGEVRRLREMDHVTAARALGARPLRVAVRHLLPGALPLVATAMAFAVPSAILLEVSLSYLGVGLPPDVPSWGELLHQAGFGAGRWWLVLFPGLAIFAAAAGLLLFAEAARALLDPRSASRGLAPPTT
jgi:peptide/nickel transport system permease protein